MDSGRRNIHPLIRLVGPALIIFAGAAWAQLQKAPHLLAPSEAFRLQATRSAPDRIRLTWSVSPGYYLYRDRFRFLQSDGEPLITLFMPDGLHKDDPYFGSTRIFRQQVKIVVALNNAASRETVANLRVISQGCADIGVCFPPQTTRLRLVTGDSVIGRADDVTAVVAASRPTPADNPLSALIGDGGLPFVRVRDNASLDAMLLDARQRGAPALVNFYADGCASCRDLENRTLTAPSVRNALAGTLLLRIDVSAKSSEHAALLARFGLKQPPAILFFNRRGEEATPHRVTGIMEPDRFATRLRNAIR